MATNPRIYLDACCFIDMAKQAVGRLPGERDADVWYVRKLLEARRDGEIDIYTSVLSIAECTHADGNMSPDVRDVFTRILIPAYVAADSI